MHGTMRRGSLILSAMRCTKNYWTVWICVTSFMHNRMTVQCGCKAGSTRVKALAFASFYVSFQAESVQHVSGSAFSQRKEVGCLQNGFYHLPALCLSHALISTHRSCCFGKSGVAASLHRVGSAVVLLSPFSCFAEIIGGARNLRRCLLQDCYRQSTHTDHDGIGVSRCPCNSLDWICVTHTCKGRRRAYFPLSFVQRLQLQHSDVAGDGRRHFFLFLVLCLQWERKKNIGFLFACSELIKQPRMGALQWSERTLA